MAIALDAGFPVSAHPTFATSFSTANSASITTPGTNRLLVVVAQWAMNATTALHVDPLSCSGAGLTWTKAKEVSLFNSGASPNGSLAVFYAFASSVITAQTITITRNSTDSLAQSAVVTVYSLSGASSTQAGATAGHVVQNTPASGSRSDSITPAAGSWVIGGVGDTGVAGGASLTAASGCTRDIEIIDATNGDTYDTVSYQGAPGGTITVGFTGTDDSIYAAFMEIQVAAGAGAAPNIGSVPAFGRVGPRRVGPRPGPMSRFRTQLAYAPPPVSAVDLGTATVAGQSSLSGNLSLSVSVAGAIAGQTAVTASLAEAIALQASYAGQSATVGDVQIAQALAGALAARSALTGSNLALAVALQAGVAGQSAATASLAEAIALQGALAGQSALAGDLSTGALAALAGAIGGQSALAATMSEAVALSGSTAGQAAAAGALSEAIAVAGTAAGQSALVATLGFSVPLAGTLAGTTALRTDLAVALALGGATAGASGLSGSLSLAVQLAGAIAGASAAAADLSQSSTNPDLAGAIPGASALVGDLSVAIARTQTQRGIGIVFVPKASPTPQTVELVGILAGGGFARASATASVALAGSFSGAAASEADLALAVALSASAASRSGGMAKLEAPGRFGDARTVGGERWIREEDVVRRIERATRAVLVDEELFARLAVGEVTKKRIRPLDRDRHEVERAREQIRSTVQGYLRHLAEHLAAVARGIGKAEEDDDPVTQAAERADFDHLQHAIEPQLRDVAQDAARRGLHQVVTPTDDMLDLANERAQAWAADHAGVLIGDISRTTRERVAELVAQAEDEGWSNDMLADELADAGVFGDARAEMIATTEVAFADVSGNVLGWKASGVVASKQWKTGAGCCDECEALDGEVIALDDEFPEGDPPLHPRCRCDLIPVVEDVSPDE